MPGKSTKRDDGKDRSIDTLRLPGFVEELYGLGQLLKELGSFPTGPVTIDNIIEKRGNFYLCQLNGKKVLEYAQSNEILIMKKLAKKALGSMNEACEITEDPILYSYLDEIDRRIEETAGLKSDSSVKIQKYSSGKRCVYDAVTDVMQNYDLTEYMYIVSEAIPKSTGRRVKDIAMLPVILPLSAAKVIQAKLMMSYLSTRILGKYDVNSASLPGLGPILGAGNIQLVSPNIENSAKSIGCSYDILEKYVLLHERLHDAQFRNFPAIDAEQKKIVKRWVLSESILARNSIPEISDAELARINGEARSSLEALMTTVEGHSEYFSKKIGDELLGFDLKRNSGLFGRLKNRIYGAARVLDRYTIGSNFIGRLYEAGGTELANLPFKERPTLRELTDPSIYIRRTNKQIK